MTTTTHVDGPVRAALAEERAFLLRSLRELDGERHTGELDEQRYHELRDRYVARAAAVLRALDGEVIDDEPTPARRPWWRQTLVLVAVAAGAVVVAVGGLLLASSIGERQPGETVTGNDQSRDDVQAAFARAVDREPDDIDARLAYARYLLQSDQPVDAIRQFDAAARLDPGNAEARAYGGWILFLAGLTDEARARIDAAVAADSSYADARFFRAMLLRSEGDRAAAASELRAYLEMAGDGPMREQVERLLDELEGRAGPSDVDASDDG